MQKHALKYLTPEEYLAMEETAEYKSDYYRGEIFAFAGGSANHNQIIINLVIKLGSALDEKKCRLFASDMKLWVAAKDLFTYPDLMIVCGKPEFYPERDDTITNPILIIEVLSESTKNYDRTEKFEFYRSIPTFQEYVLVDQYRVHIDHFSLESQGKWIYTEYRDLKDVLKLNKIAVQVSLQDIYKKVEFKVEEKADLTKPSIN